MPLPFWDDTPTKPPTRIAQHTREEDVDAEREEDVLVVVPSENAPRAAPRAHSSSSATPRLISKFSS